MDAVTQSGRFLELLFLHRHLQFPFQIAQEVLNLTLPMDFPGDFATVATPAVQLLKDRFEEREKGLVTARTPEPSGFAKSFRGHATIGTYMGLIPTHLLPEGRGKFRGGGFRTLHNPLFARTSLTQVNLVDLVLVNPGKMDCGFGTTAMT